VAQNNKLVYNLGMSKIDDIRKFAWIEFFVWFLVLCFCVVGIRLYRQHEYKKMVSYQIFLPDADGLIVGSPVRYLGVQVGYIDKIKILSNEVYIKFIITDKELKLPKGSIVTVEFSGMGGSKSLEIYPPTPESIASGKIIMISKPVRLSDSISLMNDMFGKINSIITRTSVFANETGMFDIKKGIDTKGIEENMQKADEIMKKLRSNDDGKSTDNQ